MSISEDRKVAKAGADYFLPRKNSQHIFCTVQIWPMGKFSTPKRKLGIKCREGPMGRTIFLKFFEFLVRQNRPSKKIAHIFSQFSIRRFTKLGTGLSIMLAEVHMSTHSFEEDEEIRRCMSPEEWKECKECKLMMPKESENCPYCSGRWDKPCDVRWSR